MHEIIFKIFKIHQIENHRTLVQILVIYSGDIGKRIFYAYSAIYVQLIEVLIQQWGSPFQNKKKKDLIFQHRLSRFQFNALLV